MKSCRSPTQPPSPKRKLGPNDKNPNSRFGLVVGDNVMAVHCKQETGGQFIDVHLIDAEKLPELPPTKAMSEPFKSELITEWGAKVTPENAWTEYPPSATRS